MIFWRSLRSEFSHPAATAESPPQKQLQDYTYAALGSFGLIVYWIMTDCQENPNELAIRITELTRGVRAADDSQ